MAIHASGGISELDLPDSDSVFGINSHADFDTILEPFSILKTIRIPEPILIPEPVPESVPDLLSTINFRKLIS